MSPENEDKNEDGMKYPENYQNVQAYHKNGHVKMAVIDGMLAIVVSLCFVGSILIMVGVAILNGGIWSGTAGIESSAGDMVKGLMDIIIGSGMIFGAYLFINKTVENRDWWEKRR